MKIGILQTGCVPDSLAQDFDDYDVLFQKLLAGHGFDFETWRVLDGVFPAGPGAADGWLITGSRFGAYEDHPWIAPLEDFLRAAYAAEVPIVGVCFGHQILAQALGGRVEKYAGGWSVGLRTYDNGDHLMAWHQDQVVQPPKDAVTLAGNDTCAHAMLAYGDKALTVQAHPEYDAAFIAALLRLRSHLLPEGMAAHEAARLDATPLTADRFGALFAAVFRREGVQHARAKRA